MGLNAVLSFFGRKKTPSYPFDVEKAYCITRPGIIAGGGVSYTFSEEGIVTHYEYPAYPPKNEDGMRDRGAKVFFVGLKPGTVTVTVTIRFPVSKGETKSFTLAVDRDLRVTLVE